MKRFLYMEDFAFTQYVELDMSELGKLNVVPNIDNLPIMQIKRVLTISDIIKYLKEVNEELFPINYLCINDLKSQMVIKDAKLFSNAGYRKIYIRDLAPGNTQISYIISSVNYSPSYLDGENM